jgi:hypothetical protein
MATFALANSLAGFLAPWLVVALGVTWSIVDARRASRGMPEQGGAVWIARLAGLAAASGAILVCLVLTKSRSAWLALVVGSIALVFSNAGFRRALDWRVAATALVVLALVVAGAAAVGGLDLEVLSEAGKSLEFRGQYWRATLSMIGDFPILGVGPGEFLNYYTQYKLPEASEEIRDPHNFLLEAWATGGTFAFLALVAVLAGFAWQSWELGQSPTAGADDAPGDEPAPQQALWFAAAGAAAGILMAAGVGPVFGFALSGGQILAALAIEAAVLAVLWRWAVAGTLPLRLPAVGVLVLAVNLLAAGGFAFPGVADTFWILAALGLNQAHSLPRSEGTLGQMGRLLPAAGFGVAVCGLVTCYVTGFAPVVECRAALARAADEQMTAEGRYEALMAASDADPFSAEPWLEMGRLCVAPLKENPDEGDWGSRLLAAATNVVLLDGRSSAAWREAGNWFDEIYRRKPHTALAGHIVQLRRGAAYLYPNSAAIQGEYAVALAAVGKTPAARRSAQRALELDELTPHADKKLPAELKTRLKSLLAEAKR